MHSSEAISRRSSSACPRPCPPPRPRPSWYPRLGPWSFGSLCPHRPPGFAPSVWAKDTARWLACHRRFLIIQQVRSGSRHVVYAHFTAKRSLWTVRHACKGCCSGTHNVPRTVQGRRLWNQKVLGYAPFIPGQHGTCRRMAPPRLGVSGPTKQPRWDSVSPRRRWGREGSPWPAGGPRGQGSADAHPPAPHLSFRTWAPTVFGLPCCPAQLRGTCSERFSHWMASEGSARGPSTLPSPSPSSRCCDHPPRPVAGPS